MMQRRWIIIMESGGSGQHKLKATGENPDLPGFTNKNLDIHFGGGGISDHRNQYPNMTQEQYAQLAHALVRSAVTDTILGYLATKGKSVGTIVRYNVTTNDWVRGSSTEIVTMFKPTNGIEYFNKIKGYETGS